MKVTSFFAYGKRKVKAVVVVAVSTVLVVCSVACNIAQEVGNPLQVDDADASPSQAATVVRVVDGDTLVVNIAGEDSKVRLIGIDTPESVSSDASKSCEEGGLASEHAKSLVSQGQTVWLTSDVSDTDRYGRLLRYVWLAEPDDQPSVIAARYTMLNAVMVSEGYAQAKIYPPDAAWSTTFEALGAAATEDGLGVTYKWADEK